MKKKNRKNKIHINEKSVRHKELILENKKKSNDQKRMNMLK